MLAKSLPVPKIALLALLALVFASAASAAPKERTAVADAVLGQVEISKPPANKWKKVKTGAKITHKDRIRTFAGARLDIRFPDGSTLAVEENSVLGMNELLEENGNTRSTVRVDKGTVLFSIRKLTTAQSSFEFETSTATAAIRGTEGGVAVSDGGQHGGKTVPPAAAFMLKNGALRIKHGDRVNMIGPNQLFLLPQGAEGQSFSFADGTDASDLLNRVLLGDSAAYRALSRIQGSATLIVVSPTANSVLASAKAEFEGLVLDTAVKAVRVNGVAATVQSGRWKAATTLQAAPKKPADQKTQVDLKGGRVEVKPSGARAKGDVQLPSRESEALVVVQALGAGNKVLEEISWPLSFKNIPAAATDTSAGAVSGLPAQIEVKDGRATVAGSAPSMAGRGAVLSVGTASGSAAVAADGSFTVSVPVSEANRNWQVESAQLRIGDSGAEIVVSIPLVVDRADPAVNDRRPLVGVQQLKDGKLLVSVSGNAGDRAEVALREAGSSGVPLSTAVVDGNSTARFTPLNASHDYVVEVADLSGKSVSAQLRNVEYWPWTMPGVVLTSSGGAGAGRVPPLPPGIERELMATVRVQLRGLPDNDYRAISKITVTAAGGSKQVLTESKIDGVNIDVEVPVRSSGKTTVTVKVEPKNGRPVTQSLTIDRSAGGRQQHPNEPNDRR